MISHLAWARTQNARNGTLGCSTLFRYRYTNLIKVILNFRYRYNDSIRVLKKLTRKECTQHWIFPYAAIVLYSICMLNDLISRFFVKQFIFVRLHILVIMTDF